MRKLIAFLPLLVLPVWSQALRVLDRPSVLPALNHRLNVEFAGAVKTNPEGLVSSGLLSRPLALGLHDSGLNVDFSAGYVRFSESGVVCGGLAHDTVLNVPLVTAGTPKEQSKAVKFKAGTFICVGGGGLVYGGTLAEQTTLTSSLNQPDFLSVTFAKDTEVHYTFSHDWVAGPGKIAQAYQADRQQLLGGGH
ncbi:MAG: hypothetical protein U0931_21195 [Vulcanimicrobiota bacterium]